MVKVEFGGGLETLFGGQRALEVEMPTGASIRELLQVLANQHVKERRELFLKGDTVRPGILVLINDADWELERGLDYCLQPSDNILFISTLHGG